MQSRHLSVHAAADRATAKNTARAGRERVEDERRDVVVDDRRVVAAHLVRDDPLGVRVPATERDVDGVVVESTPVRSVAGAPAVGLVWMKSEIDDCAVDRLVRRPSTRSGAASRVARMVARPPCRGRSRRARAGRRAVERHLRLRQPATSACARAGPAWTSNTSTATPAALHLWGPIQRH